jgi:hypothetical protein
MGRGALRLGIALALVATMAVAVEPNVLVSHDIPLSHTESDVAVNPKNPSDVVGATTVFSGTDGSLYNRTYMSRDGGYTWSETTPWKTRRDLTGDPRIAFSARGTAIFLTLNLSGHSSDVYRSVDGGDTWSGPARLPLFDHGLVAVDMTGGRQANRIYIAGEDYVRPKPGAPPNPMGGTRYVYLYTSDDDGKSFTLRAMPETGALGKGALFDGGGVGVDGLQVLSDGTVALEFARYDAGELGFERAYVATSTDGGKTFGKPVAVGDCYMYDRGKRAQYMQQFQKAMNAGDASLQGSVFVFAAATSVGPYRDRLYAAWPDRRSGPGRIVYAYSANRGGSWTIPRRVGGVDPGEAQFQPIIATNDRGAVALAWYSTAGFPRRDHFNAYVAISNDGGATFSKPVRVSSADSMPKSPGNDYPVPLSAKGIGTSFISAYSRWAAGGDYIGLAADGDGVFHLYWPDSRGEEYQVYSARIHTGDPDPLPTGLTARDVTSDVALLVDPLSVNPAVNEIDVPVRLQNLSRHAIYGPVSVKFLGLQNAIFKQMGRSAPQAEILNASNGESGSGAVFDYGNTLGSFGALPPGGVSEPVIWRFRLSDITNLAPITLHVQVTAR